MDTVIRVEPDYISLYNIAEYLLGVSGKLSGKRFAVIDVDTLEPDMIKDYENKGYIIAPFDLTSKIRINPPKSEIFTSKMDRLYGLLVSYINENCIIGENYKISAVTLLSAFSQEIDEIVNNKIEFPILMKRYMENNKHLHIDKRATSKGVMYSGIDLRTHHTTKDSNVMLPRPKITSDTESRSPIGNNTASKLLRLNVLTDID